MVLMPGNPYPDGKAWEDLSPLLVNGWSATGARYFSALADGNTADLTGALTVGGESRTFATLPRHLWPQRVQTFYALLRDYGMIEVQISATTGSCFPLSLSWPGELAVGKALLFNHRYQRKAG